MFDLNGHGCRPPKVANTPALSLACSHSPQLTGSSLGRAVELSPELGELASLDKVVEVLDEGHDDGEGLVVGLDGLDDGGRLGEEGKAEVEVGAVDGGAQRLDEDVDDDVGVRELGVELVAVGLAQGQSTGGLPGRQLSEMRDNSLRHPRQQRRDGQHPRTRQRTA